MVKLSTEKFNSICKHEKSCTENVIFGFFKSYLITFGIKYGINLIPALITGKLLKKPSLFYKLGGKDTISLALFLSTFISIYKGVLCGLRKIRQKKRLIQLFSRRNSCRNVIDVGYKSF